MSDKCIISGENQRDFLRLLAKRALHNAVGCFFQFFGQNAAHFHFSRNLQKQADKFRTFRILSENLQLVAHLLEGKAHKDASSPVIEASSGKTAVFSLHSVYHPCKARDGYFSRAAVS
ncbi:MAG: hypothetical protein ACFWUD_00015 [Thermocaproicibacter melissae]